MIVTHDIPKAYLYGTHYFRPPNPPRSEHLFHLRQIKEVLKFDLVRVRMQWNAIQRLPDRCDWAEYDQIMEICGDLKLRVMLETNLESAPYWLERAHPESRYVSASGVAMELGPYDSTQFGGYPGLCFHHDSIRAAAGKFLQELVDRFRSCEALLGYDCWNEPHLEPAWVCNYWANMGERLFCYCQASRLAFRKWLAGKYGSIGTLNERWGRAYGEWDDINPPNRHGTYADWLDWTRFWREQLGEHMQWRYDQIRSKDADHFIMSHSGAVPPFLPRPNAFIDNPRFAQAVDLWGTSFAPKYHNWDLATCAGTLDATRSAAGGKRYWISEMSGGSTYLRGFAKTPPPAPKDIRAWNWLAAVYGAKATIHWCYLEESTGPEATNFGLIRANGQVTERALAAAEMARTLKRYQHIVDSHRPDEAVGILYHPDHSTQLFAMEGADDLCTQSHIGYYRSVWDCDLFARYVTGESEQEIEGLRVLVLPMCLTLSDEAADRIAGFVRNGGVLIAEARTGLFDERGYNRSQLPAGRLAEVVGAVEQEAIYSDPDNRPRLNNPEQLPWPDPIYGGPPIAFNDPVEVSFRAHGYLVPLTPTTGDAVGVSGRQCLAVKNRYGRGTAYYIGTYMGLALAKNDVGAKRLLASLLGQHCTARVKGDALRPRLIEAGGEAILTVFNDHRTTAVREKISIPKEYRSIIDIHGNEPCHGGSDGLPVAVEPEGVRAFHLLP